VLEGRQGIASLLLSNHITFRLATHSIVGHLSLLFPETIRRQNTRLCEFDRLHQTSHSHPYSVEASRFLLLLPSFLNCLINICDGTAWPLHAEMQQRQRLKNLERFRKHTNGVLVATDVAARGLDIPLMDHVIHYQLPRTSEVQRCSI